MKILIITGGTSSERRISLMSAKNINVALRANDHETTLFDFKKGYPVLKKILKHYDVVFPVMHGKEGEDGMLYKFLKTAKMPYVGSDPKGANIACNKILFKRYCDSEHLPTAPWKVIRNANNIDGFGFPCVLKAAHGGSSHEVVLIRSKKDLTSPMVKKILKLHDYFFVEQLLKGVEITVGVLHNQSLPVMEIIPPGSGWFDYKNKYSGKSREIPFAPSVTSAIQRRAQKIALRIHKDLRLQSFSRTDFIVADGVPFILETNTPCGVGFTPKSVFPKAAKATGLSFHQMVEKILRNAI